MKSLGAETQDHKGSPGLNMDEREGKEQFRGEVFPCELEEIRKRRKRLDLPDIPTDGPPTAELGLVGLALSGGGIRSATFSFGVIQALAKHGLLKTVDYLSTVSGGGFIGSCLSSVLNAKDVGTEQDRFPLHYQIGAEEPLGVGQLRNSSRYLAPGGFLDKMRIPALVLRGVLSNLLIFLFILFLAVLVTEIVYEVGQRLHLPFGSLVLGGLTTFLLLVIGFPAIARWLRGGSTWKQRNFWEMAFTVALLLVMFAVFLIPVFILVEQAIDQSWAEVQETVTSDMLRPFEGRDLTQWLIVFSLLVLFMLAGRASAHVSRIGGKIVLVILGLLGPALLGTIFLALIVLEIDSPFITPDKLFNIDTRYADELSDAQISSDLRHRFAERQIRLSQRAEVVTLQEDVRWLIRDYERAFSLVREQDDIEVYPDYQDALNRGQIPPGLIHSMQRKGYIVDPITFSHPELRDNKFEIRGSKRFWVNYDETGGRWSLEQIVDPLFLVEVLQSASDDLLVSDDPSGTIIHDGVLLSDDDKEMAIRFVEEGNPHDVVMLIDNSKPAFVEPDEFRRAFQDALEEALKGIREDVRIAVFLFDEGVNTITGFVSLTSEHKQELLARLYGEGEESAPRLDFDGQLSNSPAALVRAMREFAEEGRPRAKRSILLISDGLIDVNGKGHDEELEDWIKEEFAEDAAAAGISVYGIALSKNAVFTLFHALTRKSDGAFFPVFESREGVTFDDIFGAMQKLKESAGGRLMTPIRQVSFTDQWDDTHYILARSRNGVRIRLVLPETALSTEDLTTLTDRLREVFSAQGIDLSHRAVLNHMSENRWEIDDPYRYVISRSGQKLRITAEEPNGGEGLADVLDVVIPSSLWDDSADWVFFGALLILLVYWLIVDVNVTAAHGFYRDRLSKAYLFRIAGDGGIEHNDNQKLSDLNIKGSAAPYHLINVALNLQGAKIPGLRGRRSDFFVLSKCFTGSIRTGFLETKKMEQYDGGLDLGTAMAVSGAAASPNRGVTTVKPLVFIMTLLNIRLGYWLPNPSMVGDPSWLTRLGLRRGPGPKYVLKEAVGHLDAKGKYVNVSDGGHLENLGIYELLRRRCKLIIAVDGEADPDMGFRSLIKLQLYARLDMGIEIELNLEPVRKDDKGYSRQRWVLGKIHYGEGEVGHLLYIKASVTGDEYEYVRAYRAAHPSFPHESTAEQFFTEDQFEAYRALGYQIGDEVFANEQVLAEFK